MKVEITSPGSLEVKTFATDKEKLTSEPQFYGRGDSAVVAIAKVFDKDGQLLKVHSIEIDGDNGALTIKDKSTPVQPRMYSKKSTPAVEPTKK